jgi:hypothetical protein
LTIAKAKTGLCRLTPGGDRRAVFAFGDVGDLSAFEQKGCPAEVA